MKDAIDTIKEQMQYAKENMISNHHLFDNAPNGKTISYISTECNGGVFFFHHHTNHGCTEITTSQFMSLIYADQDKFEKQGWL